MRTLYFSPRPCWPPDSGARLRDFHLARSLAKNGTLTYLAPQPYAGPEFQNPVRQHRRELCSAEVVLTAGARSFRVVNIARGFIGPTAVSVLNYRDSRILNCLKSLLTAQQFDTIQIEGVHLFSYVDVIRRLAPRARLICDWHNIESEILTRYSLETRSFAKSIYARRTAHLLRKQERRLLAACDAHAVCSLREQRVLQEWCPTAHVEVVPNGVDLQHFWTEGTVESDRSTLVFVGAMDYHANVDAVTSFARLAWPRIQQRRPDLEFWIVGSRPTEQVRSLGRIRGIRVTGTVEDLRPYYRRALAAVVPLRVGGGTRLKILEAMAAGTPVISTSLGAEGLSITPGKDILIAETVEDFVYFAESMRHHSEAWKALSANGRVLVQRKYDWKLSEARILDLHRCSAISADDEPLLRPGLMPDKKVSVAV